MREQLAHARAELDGQPRLTLAHAFYARPVVEVARDLLGCVVRHGDAAGVIVETEAYHDSEPACHAYVGLHRSARATLFGPPGRAYVYRSYGIHALLNAVCEPEGVGAAVLIRALEPLEGIEHMRERRGLERLEDLCSGPGKLTQALGVDARAQHDRPRGRAGARSRRRRRAGRTSRSSSGRGSGSPRRPSCRGASARRGRAACRGRWPAWG